MIIGGREGFSVVFKFVNLFGMVFLVNFFVSSEVVFREEVCGIIFGEIVFEDFVIFVGVDMNFCFKISKRNWCLVWILKFILRLFFCEYFLL